MFYVDFWDILFVIFPAEASITFLNDFQAIVGGIVDFIGCVLSPSQTPSNPPTNTSSTNPPPNTPPTNHTCASPDAAQICQIQGCCDFNCDNLPSGFTQAGTLGVTCPMIPTQRCCIGTTGCGYYCSTPIRSPPAGIDCSCVASACESAINSASSATDCGANCYAECIANVLGGVCIDTLDAANGAPIIVFTPGCNAQPQSVCGISFVQPNVGQCQTSTHR